MDLAGIGDRLYRLTFGRAYTFRQKALLVTVPTLVIASMVFTLSAIRTEHRTIRSEMIKRTEVVTSLASHISLLPILSENTELLRRTAASMMEIPEVSYVAFYDKSMTLLAMEGGKLPPLREISMSHETLVFENKDNFDLYAPVCRTVGDDIGLFHNEGSDHESMENVGYARIGFGKRTMRQAEVSAIRRGVSFGIVITLAVSLIVFKLFTVASRPMTMLLSAVKSLRQGTYSEINISSDDETAVLAHEFNSMSKAIREREDRLIHQTRMSAFIATIGLMLAERDEMEVILQQCTDVMIESLDANLCRIWVYSRKEGALVLVASSGMFGIHNGPYDRLELGQGEAGRIAGSRHSFFVRNVKSETEFRFGPWVPGAGVRSFVGIPLLIEDRLVGVLEAFSGRTFSEEAFNALDSASGEIAHYMVRKQAEQQIRESLDEKVLLLREVHHRVKNNMQVISSLLHLQSCNVQDSLSHEILQQSQNRIRSMALIHEKLYESEDFTSISFEEYIRSLLGHLFHSYNINADKVIAKVHIDNVYMGIDKAIPCGLILNELITNALKHAFPEGRRGQIDISIVRQRDAATGRGRYELMVSDNGVGMPEELDLENSKTLGLQLITTLAEHQLQGTLEVKRDGGISCRITFAEDDTKKRTTMTRE